MPFKEKRPKPGLLDQYEQQLNQTRKDFEALKANAQSEIRNRGRKPERQHREKMEGYLAEVESMRRYSLDLFGYLNNISKGLPLGGGRDKERAENLREDARALFIRINSYFKELSAYVQDLRLPSARPKKIMRT